MPMARAPERVPRAVLPAAENRPWLWAWLAMLPVALFRAGELAESDTFWQIRTGQFTIDHGAIPRADFLSWTADGRSWTLNSWGFNVLLAGLYNLGGLAAVALGCAVVIMIIAALALQVARLLGAQPLVAGCLLAFGSSMLILFLSARPQVIDYLAVLLLILVLKRSDWSPLRAAVTVGLLSLLWVNLHAGVVLGLGIIGAVAAFSLLTPATRGRFGRYCVLFVAALMGALVNPYGLGLFAQTLAVKDASTQFVTEWQPFDPTSPLQLAAAVIGLAALALAIRRKDVVLTGALAITFLGSLSALRILPILLLVAIPVLATELSRGAFLPDMLRRRRIVLLAGLGVVVLMAATSLSHIGRPDPRTYPSSAVIAAVPRNAHLYNSYLLGGYVALERPDVKVSIDSRNDLYGEDHLRQAQTTLRGRGDVARQLAGADSVLIPPSDGLAKRLRNDPAWSLKARDAVSVLYVR